MLQVKLRNDKLKGVKLKERIMMEEGGCICEPQ